MRDDTGPRFADQPASTFRLFRARDLARVVDSRDSSNVASGIDAMQARREERRARESVSCESVGRTAVGRDR